MGLPSVCATTCGDGIIAGGETCDDNNAASNDGCSSTCHKEPGWACAGMPSACVEVCGDGLKVGVETCDDGNKNPGDGCDAFCATETGYTCSGSPSVCSTTCGDGVKAGAEICDDGNVVNGDCCSSSCTAEPGCEIEVNDAYNTANDFFALQQSGVVKALIKPIGDKDCFSFTNATPVNVKAETFEGPTGILCPSIDTVIRLYNSSGTQLGTDDDSGPGACSIIDPTVAAYARQLPAGTYSVCAEDFGNNGLIGVYQMKISFTAICGNGALEPYEQCDDGNQVNGDGCDNNCVSSCGNGVLDGVENCDDGNQLNNDGCSQLCQKEAGWNCVGLPSVCTAICGDGLIKGPEACDDANVASNDGCSSSCQVEGGFSCTGQPSVCSGFETFCNDGVDNNNNGLTDAADPTCALPAYFTPCSAGQSLRVFPGPGTPIAIPDSNATGVSSTIAVNNAGTVNRVAIIYNITHTWDSDVDIFFTGPNNTQLDVCTDNGSSADNFTNTVLDSTCATSVVSGAAPFTGCYAPETSFATYNGASGNGNWTLKVADDLGGDTGTLQNWRLIMCTTP